MAEYIYPTRANSGDEWLKVMLENWKESRLPLLCFPWVLFGVHTITDQSFWLYMYYSYAQTDIPSLQGILEYRLHITNWGLDKYTGKDIYPARIEEDGTAWFLCDRFEKICRSDNQPLHLTDFVHKYHKALGSTMRNSIPPVICKTKIISIESYP